MCMICPYYVLCLISSKSFENLEVTLMGENRKTIDLKMNSRLEKIRKWLTLNKLSPNIGFCKIETTTFYFVRLIKQFCYLLLLALLFMSHILFQFFLDFCSLTFMFFFSCSLCLYCSPFSC